MKMLSTLLLLIIVAITGLALLNWDALSVVTAVSVGLTIFEAPWGCSCWGSLHCWLSCWWPTCCLCKARYCSKRVAIPKMQAQRELADKAEASRTELRAFLEQQQSQAHAALLNRLDNMETRLTARAQESDNTTAAYVGHLEQKAGGRRADGLRLVTHVWLLHRLTRRNKKKAANPKVCGFCLASFQVCRPGSADAPITSGPYHPGSQLLWLRLRSAGALAGMGIGAPHAVSRP